MVKFLGKEYNELQAFIKDNTSGDAIVFPYIVQEKLYSDNSMGWDKVYSLRHRVYHSYYYIKLQ